MNIAYIRTDPCLEKRDCGFQSKAPAESSHCQVFVHGYADVPYHWHREMEILFVLRGNFRLVVDGQVCEMGEGDVIIINADVPHNSTSISRDALICGAHLDVAHFERMGLPGFASRQYLCRTFLHSRPFMNKVAAIKAFMARLALDQLNHPEEGMVRETIANLLACYIYRSMRHEEPDSSTAQLRSDSRTRILRIMHTISRCEDTQHLGEIAEAEGLTLSHLSRLFKRHLGIGYRDYSQNLRLDNAAEELRTTDSTIAMIMERNGFGNPAVFYNKFRCRFGFSPAEFRRGSRPLKPQSVLTHEDAAEAQKILASHAIGLGKAAELAVGLGGTGRGQIVLSAPHNASAI
ncbi:helix-turn-helix transcriptional regulator [Mesorhizobium qingshengii]|uniref:AraC-type DNA-binding protein n=1 Tax=Mesorhizobium qingshengii TaxID=1165689 RepID=A0A1G5Z9C7_9HYPH|nr:helix-turn-helix domain-containing protein [Mesorhizobium qingshengii]SDA91659.1 AraC-type DNA-binding protein [Mesorhizobium qingshengii]